MKLRDVAEFGWVRRTDRRLAIAKYLIERGATSPGTCISTSEFIPLAEQWGTHLNNVIRILRDTPGFVLTKRDFGPWDCYYEWEKLKPLADDEGVDYYPADLTVLNHMPRVDQAILDALIPPEATPPKPTTAVVPTPADHTYEWDPTGPSLMFYVPMEVEITRADFLEAAKKYAAPETEDKIRKELGAQLIIRLLQDIVRDARE